MSEPRLDVSAGPRSPWWGVHASRYHFAEPLVEGRRVLDVACGTGYGLTILAASARAVVGVDADADAVHTAASGLGARQALVVGDGVRLPFADGVFGAITSFETIEHLHRRDDFLAELRRVLRPDGICVVSTPNASYTQPVNGVPRNPFHVHEYTPEELKLTLDRQFRSVTLLGQQLDRRFAISPFWDDQRRLPRSLAVQARLGMWRVFNRLPEWAGDALSRALLRQPLVPTERDYQFSQRAVAQAPVLVAVCRPGG
jgi:SAM-dependent methyltransferase